MTDAGCQQLLCCPRYDVGRYRRVRVKLDVVYVDRRLLMLILSLRKCENGYIGDSVVVIAVRRRWASTS